MSFAPPDNPPAALRRSAYLLLIVSAVGVLLGRIAHIEADHGRTPFLSANDRSRWAAIRALVDHGTFHIDDVIYDSQRGRVNKDWDTIDKVRHVGRDGREHFYSSKPPLLIMLLAAEYQCVKRVTGANLADNPFTVARIMLVLTNVLPLALAWWWLARRIDRYGTTDWGRMFAVAALVWGTFLTTMAGTLNNHSVAAVCVMASLCLFLPIWEGESRSWLRFMLLGALATFAAANDLPALSFTGLIGLFTLLKAPKPTLLFATPAAILVAAAFFASNHYVHGSWKMPYAHRSDGPVVAAWQHSKASPLGVELQSVSLPAAIAGADSQLLGVTISPEAQLSEAEGENRWQIWDPQTSTRWAVVRQGDRVELRRWGNWYEYEGSYWMTPRKGVDRGEASRGVYLFHILLGHNGWFSLTPLWLMALAGAMVSLRDRRSPLWPVALAALLLLVVCTAFYVTRPQIDRNYGGVATGFRWLFWLVPLWSLALLPAADRMAGNRWARGVALLLLLASVFSAAYGAMNPWSHPWLFDYWTAMQWISYP